MNSSNFFARLFKGRINRETYLTGLIILSCVALYLNMVGIGAIYKSLLHTSMSQMAIDVISIAIYVITAIYFFSFTLRRAHDIGVGWDVFLRYGIRDWITRSQLVFKKGDPEDNQFGTIPSPNINLLTLLGIK
ncbi:MAG: DUF805 domain-containing protein [Candidatus Roizmanbacteria bacterium]|nr:DUF805 domain-containing protein [Candidatus Roizmanbacteria bacterium]